MTSTEKHKCLFCRIANGQEDNMRLLYDQDGIVIFRDIRPAASHHYLIVPKTHVKTAKHLSASDRSLVETLVSVGKQFLQEQGGDVSDARLGFHWPPFHSVEHLHLHVISPQADMGWLARGIFKVDSWWFKTPHWVLQQLPKETEL
ncbi:hypothetical protein ACOMHN_034764 [Nucella lapillus]